MRTKQNARGVGLGTNRLSTEELEMKIGNDHLYDYTRWDINLDRFN